MIWQAPLRGSCAKAFYFLAKVHHVQTSHVTGHHGTYLGFPVRHKNGKKKFHSLYYLAEDFGHVYRLILWTDWNNI